MKCRFSSKFAGKHENYTIDLPLDCVIDHIEYVANGYLVFYYEWLPGAS